MQTLEDYHDRIEALMAEGQTYLAQRDPASEEMVKRRIADSGLLIAAYQLFVHREIFAPLLAAEDASTRARVSELKVECIALTEDLRFNIRDFTAKVQNAPLDWDSVTDKVAWYNARVREHIANVRAIMAPDLTDADHARLRARRSAFVGAQAA